MLVWSRKQLAQRTCIFTQKVLYPITCATVIWCLMLINYQRLIVIVGKNSNSNHNFFQIASSDWLLWNFAISPSLLQIVHNFFLVSRRSCWGCNMAASFYVTCNHVGPVVSSTCVQDPGFAEINVNDIDLTTCTSFLRATAHVVLSTY